jgi:hypothetical protein
MFLLENDSRVKVRDINDVARSFRQGFERGRRYFPIGGVNCGAEKFHELTGVSAPATFPLKDAIRLLGRMSVEDSLVKVFRRHYRRLGVSLVEDFTRRWVEAGGSPVRQDLLGDESPDCSYRTSVVPLVGDDGERDRRFAPAWQMMDDCHGVLILETA